MTKNTLDDNVERIRQEYHNNVPTRKLAKQYGVSEQAIYDCVTGRSYSYRGGPVTHRNEKLSDTEKAEIMTRYRDGQDIQKIASEIGRSYQLVHHWCVVRGEDG